MGEVRRYLVCANKIMFDRQFMLGFSSEILLLFVFSQVYSVIHLKLQI